VQIDWFTFVAQIVNFLILIALLQRFLYKPVIKAMDEREQKVASELEEARLKKVEAEQKERELDQHLKEFESKKKQMLEEAKQEVNQQRKEWMGQLREDISEIRERWIVAVESEKKAFLDHLKEETGEQVVRLVQKVLGDLSDRNLQQQTAGFLIEKLHELGDAEKEKLWTTMEQLNTSQAVVISSYELDGQQKHELADLLRELSGRKLECEFEVSESLGFGVEVRVGGWRLGWNLASYLQGLREQMDRFFREGIPLRKSTSME
jgi:F-type H+-transporting ATPase subunit b